MEGKTILCISTRKWNSLWRSTQQVISRMAAKNQVYFFEPGRNPDMPFFSEFKRNLSNYFFLEIKEVQKGLFIVSTPSNFPHGLKHLPRILLRIANSIVTTLNDRILSKHIWRVMKKMDIHEPMLWFYDLFSHNLVGKFGEFLSCYHHYDEIAEFAPNAGIKDLIQEIDNRMACNVDIVFASSNLQTERLKKVNPNTYFLPNAVDFNFFNQALSGTLPIPSDIAALSTPIIGFIGWIGYHIDIPLLNLISESFPYCSIVLIGPDQLPDGVNKQKLKSRSNVFFLGEKKMDELPSYLQTFDVALMPWLLTSHMRYAYPLKLHEYLSAGKPPVATALPELQPFSHVVRIAETHHEFIEHIKDALVDTSRASVEMRVNVARNNTWDQRVSEIYRVIDKYLDSQMNSRQSECSQGKMGSLIE